MPTLLALETSTTACSVALSINGKIIAQRQTDQPNSHAQTLTVFIDEVMKESGLAYQSLDAIAVSEGPGSYTGLRIGVSSAKGLCYALSKPLIAISTLQTMCLQVQRLNATLISPQTLLVPMIDARRMEVYSAIYNSKSEIMRAVEAEIITEEAYSTLLNENHILFFGNGAEKCTETIIHPNAQYIHNIVPLASDMLTLAEASFAQNKFVDIAYFEPFYLKEFMVSLPKNKVL